MNNPTNTKISTTKFATYLRFASAKKKAKSDDKVAQYNLAELHLQYGQYQEALGWYKKSAKQGYAPAQSRLGQMYLEAIHVKKDLEKAVFWYKQAAEQGLDVAQSLNTALQELGKQKEQEN